MADKENKFFSEIKNQIIAGVGLVIAAGFGIFITNMESWFAPKEEPPKHGQEPDGSCWRSSHCWV